MTLRTAAFREFTLGAVAALVVVLAYTPAASAVLPSLELPGLGVDEQLIHPSGSEVKISWQAVAPEASLVFRVYRGDRGSDLRLLYEIPAIPGQWDYAVDDLPQIGGQIYELRVASQQGGVGSEVTLRSIEVLLVESGMTDFVTAPQPRPVAYATASSDLRSFGLSNAATEGSAALECKDRRDPPVPPPRSV